MVHDNSVQKAKKKRGVGRPPKPEGAAQAITIRVPKAMLAGINARAKKERLTQREAILAYLTEAMGLSGG